MDLNMEQTHIIEDTKTIIHKGIKRKCENPTEVPNKKLLTEITIAKVTSDLSTQQVQATKESDTTTDTTTASTSKQILLKTPEKRIHPKPEAAPQSPKKRLNVNFSNAKTNKNKQKFIYGNYNQYYGYRNCNAQNNNGNEQGFHDIRLDVFKQYKEIFRDKEVLDIGCNSGYVTMELAKHLEVKSIAGLDIDKSLINQAVKSLIKCKKSLPMENDLKRKQKFPFNVKFVHGNYVLKDKVLLEIERPQFDVIMCLSLTKWIQLNFGDDGLKLAFKRMFLQLRPQGVLVLEPQPYDNYGRRKKMTDTIFENYKAIKLFPQDFTAYLLSSEVGFSKMNVMAVPDHCKKGFKRPIQIFHKE